MRVAVTGTPGTGKTTATRQVETGLDVIHLNEIVHEEGFVAERDAERDTAVADLDAVADYLDGRDDILFESHLAHHFDADSIAVLRCHPEQIEERLRARGESPEKARENAESEALDLILSEAVRRHGTERVYEIDTTDRPPEAVAAAIEAVAAGERDPEVGVVSFVEYL